MSFYYFRLIQSASEKQNKSCTEILLDEWGTSGKVRPNLNTLLQLLIKAQFYRAAEYVAVELLKGEINFPKIFCYIKIYCSVLLIPNKITS